ALLRGQAPHGLRRVRHARRRQRPLRAGRPAGPRARPQDVQGQPHPLQPDGHVRRLEPRGDRRLPGRARGARDRRDGTPHPGTRHRRRVRPARRQGMKLWRSRRTPRVLFIHAGGVDGRMWHPLAERLDGLRLHIPDLRGHGSTPLPPGEYAHADDLLSLLDDLRIKRATLVGASLGGWVALQLATKAPERVNGLALLASTYRDRDEDEWSPEIVAFHNKEEALLEADDIDGAVALGLRVWTPRPGVRDLVETMTRDAFAHQHGVEAPERPLPVDLGA